MVKYVVFPRDWMNERFRALRTGKQSDNEGDRDEKTRETKLAAT